MKIQGDNTLNGSETNENTVFERLETRMRRINEKAEAILKAQQAERNHPFWKPEQQLGLNLKN